MGEFIAPSVKLPELFGGLMEAFLRIIAKMQLTIILLLRYNVSIKSHAGRKVNTMKAINTKDVLNAFRAFQSAQNDLSYYTKMGGVKDEMKTKVAECRRQLEAASAPLTEAIKEAEGKAKERTIAAWLVVEMLDKIERKLGLTKKAMNGITASVDLYAQDVPRAYKYKMMGTRFEAEYKAGSWRITKIWRDEVRRGSQRVYLTLTDDAKAALIEKYEHPCL